MLKKFVSGGDKDWDQLLPYLLFGYREVPQASTGFSPIELLHGRSVRGPLDVLILYNHGSVVRRTQRVVSHIIQIREMMDKMTELVHENLEQSRDSQKHIEIQGGRRSLCSPSDPDKQTVHSGAWAV